MMVCLVDVQTKDGLSDFNFHFIRPEKCRLTRSEVSSQHKPPQAYGPEHVLRVSSETLL